MISIGAATGQKGKLKNPSLILSCAKRPGAFNHKCNDFLSNSTHHDRQFVHLMIPIPGKIFQHMRKNSLPDERFCTSLVYIAEDASGAINRRISNTCKLIANI